MNDTQGTIVLIHGLWMTPKSWDGWKGAASRRPATPWSCPHGPAWNDEIDAMRRDPSALNGLRVFGRSPTIWPGSSTDWTSRRSSWAIPSAACSPS